jgi:hypothetical protein
MECNSTSLARNGVFKVNNILYINTAFILKTLMFFWRPSGGHKKRVRWWAKDGENVSHRIWLDWELGDWSSKLLMPTF